MTSVYVTPTTEPSACHHPPLDHARPGRTHGDQDGDGGVAGRPDRRQRARSAAGPATSAATTLSSRGFPRTSRAGTNPEELIGAAQAAATRCSWSAMLANGGRHARVGKTEARVQLLKQGEGFGITRIEIFTVGRVPGLDQAGFEAGGAGGQGGVPDHQGARHPGDHPRGVASRAESTSEAGSIGSAGPVSALRDQPTAPRRCPSSPPA